VISIIIATKKRERDLICLEESGKKGIQSHTNEDLNREQEKKSLRKESGRKEKEKSQKNLGNLYTFHREKKRNQMFAIEEKKKKVLEREEKGKRPTIEKGEKEMSAGEKRGIDQMANKERSSHLGEKVPKKGERGVYYEIL